MQTIHVHLVITLDKPVKALSDLVAGRASTIDGVSNVEVDETKSGSFTEEPEPEQVWWPAEEVAALHSAIL